MHQKSQILYRISIIRAIRREWLVAKTGMFLEMMQPRPQYLLIYARPPSGPVSSLQPAARCPLRLRFQLKSPVSIHVSFVYKLRP